MHLARVLISQQWQRAACTRESSGRYVYVKMWLPGVKLQHLHMYLSCPETLFLSTAKRMHFIFHFFPHYQCLTPVPKYPRLFPQPCLPATRTNSCSVPAAPGNNISSVTAGSYAWDEPRRPCERAKTQPAEMSRNYLPTQKSFFIDFINRRFQYFRLPAHQFISKCQKSSERMGLLMTRFALM